MSSGKKKKKPGNPPKKTPSGKGSKRSFSPLASIRLWFKDKPPVLQFLLAFLGCMILFYLFYYGSFYKNYLETPFLNLQANLSNGLLNLIGHDTQVRNGTVFSEQFSVNIFKGCDGLQAMAILVSGILIFPASFRLKLPGLAIGIITLFFLNLIRIAGLYLIGLNFSTKVFELFHLQGGFIIFTMISVVILFSWMSWAMKKSHPDPKTNEE